MYPATQVNSAFRLFGVGKLNTRLRAGVEAGRVHLCQVAGNSVIPVALAGDVP